MDKLHIAFVWYGITGRFRQIPSQEPSQRDKFPLYTLAVNMKLILCAGTRHIPGFKTHDVKQLGGIDYVCDLFNITNHIKDGECEEIHLTHALEHFPQKETQKVLGLLHNLLREGGSVYIEVPNFMWHATLLMDGKQREAVYYAYGGQLDEWDFHKTGFTYQILKEELEKAGFRDIHISGADSLTATARK